MGVTGRGRLNGSQPHSPSLLPHGENKVSGWEKGGIWGRRGKVQGKGGGLAAVHGHASLGRWSLVIATHHKNANWPE